MRARRYPVPPFLPERPRQDPNESIDEFLKRIEENIRRNAYPLALEVAYRDLGCWRKMLTPGQRRAVVKACAEALGVELTTVQQ